MNLKSTITNGFNFRVITLLMESWGPVRVTWLDFNSSVTFRVRGGERGDFFMKYASSLGTNTKIYIKKVGETQTTGNTAEVSFYEMGDSVGQVMVFFFCLRKTRMLSKQL